MPKPVLKKEKKETEEYTKTSTAKYIQFNGKINM